MSKSVSERPAIPTEVERLAQRASKRAEKDVRQAARGRPSAIARLKELRRAQAQQNTQNKDLLKGLESQAQELLKDIKEEAASAEEQSNPTHASRMQAIESELSQIQSALQASSLSSSPSSPSPQDQEQITQAAQDASSAETQKLESDPEALPPSGRPDGQQDVGELNQRSLHNVRRTIEWRKRAEDNEAKIEEMENKSGGGARLTPPEEIIKPGEENQQKRGWFGGFFGGGKR